MKKQFQNFRVPVTVISSAVLLFAGCKKYGTTNGGGYPPVTVNSVVKASSGDSIGVVTKINEFRLLAGDPLNTAPGAETGRREINWDAVPAAFTNANNFPFDFFGASDSALPNGRKRGLILQSTGTSFRVDSTSFADIDASYATQFEAFSKKRLFAYMDNNVTEVTFKIPGTITDAFVKGFGVVFTDVDDANSTSIEYFNGNKSLGIFNVPVRTVNGSFSFLGVNFPDEKVTKVKITSGNGILGAGIKDISDGGTKDLVVMDDFIYDEPKKLN
jgi:hypothetical protein